MHTLSRTTVVSKVFIDYCAFCLSFRLDWKTCEVNNLAVEICDLMKFTFVSMMRNRFISSFSLWKNFLLFHSNNRKPNHSRRGGQFVDNELINFAKMYNYRSTSGGQHEYIA